MGTHYRNYLNILVISVLLFGCTPLSVIVNNDNVTAQNNRCWQQTSNIYGTTSKSMARVLIKEIADYQSLVEQSLTYRARMIKTAQLLKENIAQDKPLSGADLDTLNQGMLTYLKHRQKLYQVAESHECWLNSSPEIFKQLGMEPMSPENRLKGIMLSLSAALLLYDNYLLAISIFEEDDKLRRVLNERDTGYDIGQDELTEITDSYNSLTNRERVQTALSFYNENLATVSAYLRKDRDFNYLQSLIEQSPSYNITQSDSPIYLIGRQLDFLGAVTSDILYDLGNEGINLFSQLFGNAVGLIEIRQGKLYNRAEVLDKVTDQIKAGDILLEKTPFRLTDQFIPGHWGHAAIWAGTEAELKSLGIWNHPVVQKYHDSFKTDHAVVEALRSGVQMSSLPHFLNIDDLAILRNTHLNREEIADRIILALRQVGKEYDFNFDVETTDKIVCSELVYVVYTGIEWPTEKTLGRFTISPDNVASKALDDGPLKLMTFFHDGEWVEHQSLQLMSQLMGIAP